MRHMARRARLAPSTNADRAEWPGAIGAEERLVRAVKTVAGGGKVLGPDIAAKVISQMTSGRPAAAAEQVEPLSERELDVLRLAAHGLTNKAVAAELVHL